MAIPVSRVKGVGPNTAEYLLGKGVATVEALISSGYQVLVTAPGFGEGRARNVLQAASALLNEHEQGSMATDEQVKIKKAKKKKKKAKLPKKDAKDKKKEKKEKRKEKKAKKGKKGKKGKGKKKK